MKKITAALFTAALLGAAAATPLWATNGMDMIGYSSRSSGMGGADVAVDADATAVGGNPAVITGAAPSSATLGVSVLMPEMSMTHNTMAGPDSVDSEDQYFAMPQLGYVHKLQGMPLAVGMGVYAQGGMGVDFQDVDTGMGTQDELTSQVSFMRINPVVAYQPIDAVSIGATLMVGYAQAQFSMYPDTSYGDVFYGMDVTGLTSWGYAGRIGAQFKLGPMVRVGATYTTESKMDLDGGEVELDFGGQKATYDAELDDFSWPQEVEVGVAVLPAKGLTVAADVKWINWSATIDKPVLKITDPDTGETVNEITFDMNWDDQWVYALGVEYAINGMNTVRAGFNYGKSPVPDDNLNPLFPATVEKHLTLGYGLNLGKWTVDLAYEHAFENVQENNNTDQSVNPFGAGLEVSHAQNSVHAAVTYRY